jgi:large subunit ribosomal protein L32
MAVPKKKQSKSRRNKRRANHDRMAAPSVVLCPRCSEPKLPHRVCPNCGTYNGREVPGVAKAGEE